MSSKSSSKSTDPYASTRSVDPDDIVVPMSVRYHKDYETLANLVLTHGYDLVLNALNEINAQIAPPVIP